MRPFDYQRPARTAHAINVAASQDAGGIRVQYLAGGTILLDLMKLDVVRPSLLVDISRLEDAGLRGIDRVRGGLRFGALVTMAELAADRGVARDYPVITQSLQLGASAQLRNMASLGGNVLQRTRCSYFRDVSYRQCNKRTPGSGCAALDGHHRSHAVLGVSNACIAAYPGDWAQALIALDARIEVIGAAGGRSLRFADLHRLPGATPHVETVLAPGDLITGFFIPEGPWRRSCYVKIRDRASYAFANASAAVALVLDGDRVTDVRIGLGGVATVPWRAVTAEAVLRGHMLDEATAQRAADAEFAAASARDQNTFKVPLGKATMVRALLEAKALEIGE